MAPCLQTRNQSLVVVLLSGQMVDVGTIFTLQFYNNCTQFFVNWLVHVLPLMYQTLLLANGAYHRMKLE